jgi:hypothetical protein
MATFKGRTGTEWQVELDAPTIEEIKQDHGVNLVNLDKDPLGSLRNDPMLLVTVISALCREQIDAKQMSPVQFAKQLPSPPDAMLDALRDAVVNFFPSGRASHVREVLSKFDQMSEKTDQLATAKMQQVMDDPKVMQTLDAEADRVITETLASLMGQSAGT